MPCADQPCVYACTNYVNDWVRFGTSAFTGTENQAASIIGHELMHAAGSFGECTPYQWEIDHQNETAINPCDLDYRDSVDEQLEQRDCPP